MEEGRPTMSERTTVARQTTDQFELCLWESQADGETQYEVVMNGVFIMASYNQVSSTALVDRAMARLGPREDVRVLVGGLGMGLSAAAAVAIGSVSQVDVVELEPVIVNWNRTWFADLNAHCLEDPRLDTVVGDFHDYVMTADARYDLVCLDVDNGPEMLVRDSNARIYGPDFLRAIREIVKPDGVFSLWAYTRNEDLVREITEVFSACSVEEVWEEHERRRQSYCIYLAP